MQIKTTKRYNYIPLRMTTIKKTDTPKLGNDVEQPKLSHIAIGNVNWPTTLKNSWSVSYKHTFID